MQGRGWSVSSDASTVGYETPRAIGESSLLEPDEPPRGGRVLLETEGMLQRVTVDFLPFGVRDPPGAIAAQAYGGAGPLLRNDYVQQANGSYVAYQTGRDEPANPPPAPPVPTAPPQAAVVVEELDPELCQFNAVKDGNGGLRQCQHERPFNKDLCGTHEKMLRRRDRLNERLRRAPRGAPVRMPHRQGRPAYVDDPM